MQTLNLQLRGLYTHPNPLSEVPPGSLTKAKNMVMDKEGIIETRRGFKKYGTQLSLAMGEKLNSMFNYQSTLLLHYGSKIAYDSDGAGTWADYSGTFSPPSGAVNIRTLEANKNLYLATSTGIQKLSSVTGAISAAGMYKGLDGTATVGTSNSGFLSTANQVAYRIVWAIRDANNNLILGSPSQRIIAINASGSSQDVTVAITIPSGVTTSHFFQIYRSLMSGGSAIVPNDELGLVYEAHPTAGEISALTISVTDSVPESLRGTTIYTAPSQQGISQANDIPPLCQDMAFYKNVTLFANVTSKQRLNLTLLAEGGSSGIQSGDTITIAGVTYTGAGSEDPTMGQFKVDGSGTPAENIDSTAQSIVRVINQYVSTTRIYAYYLSGYNDLPGQILLEERSIGGATFAAIGSRGGAFNPPLPTSGATVSSSNDNSINRIFISKVQQPEAVPLLNYIDIGSANKAVIRVIALRDSVFVFKQDGVFRITGQEISSFQVSLFDVTVTLSASETAVPFNNQIYAYTSQGVIGASDTGVGILSRPIEVDLLQIATFTNFPTLSFGVAYNSDRKYILAIQTKSSDTYATQAYIYNSITNAWTLWVRNWTCGIVNSADNKLYFGMADTPYVYQERKAFTSTDYADEELAVTITAINGTTVNVNSTSGISAGWSLSQGSKVSVITKVVDATTLTMTDSLTWNLDTATVYNPIAAEVETSPMTAQNPGILKHHQSLVVFFKKASFKKISIGIRSDISAFLTSEDISPLADQGWGNFPWGQFPWGGTTPDLQPIRTYIPRDKRRSRWISANVSHSTAKDNFAIAGFSMTYEPMSERSK